MLKWQKTKKLELINESILLELYKNNRNEFSNHPLVINYLLDYCKFFWNSDQQILRIIPFLFENLNHIDSVKASIKRTYENPIDLLSDLYIYWKRYILMAPPIVDKHQFYYHLETTISYSLSSLIKKSKRRYWKPLDYQTYSDPITIYSNVDFYNWFYSTVGENSLYTDMWEFFPISKDSYCKFINKEVKPWLEQVL